MNAKPYPKYKPSGVEWLGDVPEHWEVKRGRFSVRVNPPSEILRKLPVETEVSFVPMEAVGVDGGLKLDQEKPISEVGAGYTEFQEQDIVVAKITPCFENGKAAIAQGLTNKAAYGTTELHVLRSRKDMDHRFLFYVVLSDTFRKLGEAEMYGAGGQKRVPPEFCKDFRISIPPRPEQEAIADFLDDRTAKLDALIEKKRALIGKLKEKRSALISRTVTKGLPPEAVQAGLNPKPKLKPSGNFWLGDIPEHWKMTRIKRITSVRGRIGFRGYTTDDLVNEEDGVLALGGSNLGDNGLIRLDKRTFLTWEKYDESPEIQIEIGDLVLGQRGTCGKVALIKDDITPATINPSLVILKQPSVDARYLCYWILGRFVQSIFDSFLSATAVPMLSQQQIGNVDICHPPFAEQEAIANYLDRETANVDRMIQKVETAIEKLTEYRTALITAAVTGKIDVRHR